MVKMSKAELLELETKGLFKRVFDDQNRAKELKKDIETKQKALATLEKSIKSELERADNLGILEQDGFELKIRERKLDMSVVQKKVDN